MLAQKHLLFLNAFFIYICFCTRHLFRKLYGSTRQISFAVKRAGVAGNRLEVPTSPGNHHLKRTNKQTKLKGLVLRNWHILKNSGWFFAGFSINAEQFLKYFDKHQNSGDTVSRSATRITENIFFFLLLIMKYILFAILFFQSPGVAILRRMLWCFMLANKRDASKWYTKIAD